MKKVIMMLLSASVALSAIAAKVDDAPAAECEGLTVATGPAGKGYSNLFADVKKVCGRKVNLCELTTGGGLDNLNALSTKKADVGFVQVDTWKVMKNGDDTIAALQNLMAVNSNYLHIVVAAGGFNVEGPKKLGFMKGDQKTVVIQSFSQLRGQTVAVVGTAQILGRQLDKQYGYGIQFVDVKSDNEAFALVKNGKVAAAFTVSGWPSGTVSALSQSSGLTLVPFDAPASDPYRVKALNYKNIAVYNMNSLGVQNMIVTRQFTGARQATVAAFRQCITANMDELKQGRYEPGWNEANPNSQVSEITPFKSK